MSWHAQPGIQAPVSQPARQPATIADAVAVPAACCRGTWRGSGSGCGTSAELIMMELPLIRSPVCLPASLAAGAAWRRGQPSCLLCSAKSGGGALWRVPRQAQASAARTAGGRSEAASAAAVGSATSPMDARKMLPPSQPAATSVCPTEPGSAAARPNCPDSRKLLALHPCVCPTLALCNSACSQQVGGQGAATRWRGKGEARSKKQTRKTLGPEPRTHARTHAGGRARALLSRGCGRHRAVWHAGVGGRMRYAVCVCVCRGGGERRNAQATEEREPSQG